MAAKATVSNVAAPIEVQVVGTTLEVDVAKFSPEVVTYVLTYGLRQMLNDTHASITAKVEPDDTKRAAQKLAAAEKKLASLLAGEVAQQRTGGGSVDPVVAEMRRMAETKIKAAIKANGKKIADYTKTLPGMIDKLVERDEAELRPVAERVVAERRNAPAIELPSLDDLMA